MSPRCYTKIQTIRIEELNREKTKSNHKFTDTLDGKAESRKVSYLNSWVLLGIGPVADKVVVAGGWNRDSALCIRKSHEWRPQTLGWDAAQPMERHVYRTKLTRARRTIGVPAPFHVPTVTAYQHVYITGTLAFTRRIAWRSTPVLGFAWRCLPEDYRPGGRNSCTRRRR